MSKKEINIFFMPYMNGEGCACILMIIILIPFILIGLAVKVFTITIGPIIEPLVKTYLSLVSLPIIFICKPESLANRFGTTTMSESEIQSFFQKSLSNTSELMNMNINLIFSMVMLILIMIYFYKVGIKKGNLARIIRSFIINILITVPVWGYVINGIPMISKGIDFSMMHYTEIYASMQAQVKLVFTLLLFMIIVVTFISEVILGLLKKREKEMDT